MDLHHLLFQITGNKPVDSCVALPDIAYDGRYDCAYPVSTLAALTVGAAAHCLQSYVAGAGHNPGRALVSQGLASLWFKSSVRPRGWTLPPNWDDIAGIYRASDNFIRLHTNAAHHRAAALQVLDAGASRDQVARVVSQWQAEALEQAIVDANGCAAALRNREQWQAHEQGQAVAAEPLVHWKERRQGNPRSRPVDPARPLRGVRVLDLTRVLAGPTSTRWLAAFGATVLRLDPDHWDEPACTVEMSAGKHRAALDLRQAAGKQQFLALLSSADVLVHGYRADALDRLGLGEDTRYQCNPGLVDVALCAYGWTGPWRHRRGFDSLVQMSSGIADEGARAAGRSEPVPLPVQALDHATGYLMAASVLHALHRQQCTGTVLQARLSLARTACLLEQLRASGSEREAGVITDANPLHFQSRDEQTDWGAMQRLQWPVRFDCCQPGFDVNAGNLRTAQPAWPA